MQLRKYHKITILSAALFFAGLTMLQQGCKSESSAEKKTEEAASEKKVYDRWLIDYENVESGCDRVDCIRSIDTPKFITIGEVDFLKEDDLVIGLKMDDAIRCYPHAILNWHEIVNDKIDGKNIAVNFCPLTGSGMAWDRTIEGKITNFGVSGMLFNSNIIPYDRNTRSAWSQMKQLCVNGALCNAHPTTYQVVETTWGTWKKLYPTSMVESTNTGMQRDYSNYPYGDYRENRELYFDVEFENDTLHPKERLFGIIQNNKAKCYRFGNFKGGVRILNDTVFDKHIIVVGSERDNFITAFENPEDKKFTPSVTNLPGLFKDADGNLYDVFGYCVVGAKKGSRLTPINGFIAYWFGWYAFYPELTFI